MAQSSLWARSQPDGAPSYSSGSDRQVASTSGSLRPWAPAEKVAGPGELRRRASAGGSRAESYGSYMSSRCKSWQRVELGQRLDWWPRAADLWPP